MKSVVNEIGSLVLVPSLREDPLTYSLVDVGVDNQRKSLIFRDIETLSPRN